MPRLTWPRRLRGAGLAAELRRGGIASVLAEGAARAVLFALSILLARSLGAAGFGIYAFATALMTVLVVPAQLGVPQLLTREIAQSHNDSDWARLWATLKGAVVLTVVGAAATGLAGMVAVWALGGGLAPAKQAALAVIFASLPLFALIRVFAGALRGLRRVGLANTVVKLLRPTIGLVLLGGLFALVPAAQTAPIAVAGQAVAAGATVTIGAWLLARALPGRAAAGPTAPSLGDLARLAWPFAFVGVAAVLVRQTDMLAMGILADDAAVGIYRVAVQGAILVLFALQVGSNVMGPYFARLHRQGDTARLQRLVTLSARVMGGFAFCLAAVFVAFGDVLAAWVFGPAYAASHGPLAILAVGQAVNAATGAVGLLLAMTGHERLQARVMGSALVANVVLNAALIPPLGGVGAALGTALSFIGWNVALAWFARQRLGIDAGPFRRLPRAAHGPGPG